MAGCGKTDLLLGLAAKEHTKSIIFRREYEQLKSLIDRSEHLFAAAGTFNRTEHVWHLHGGRVTEFGACKNVADAKKWQGRDHDLKAFDEIAHFTISMFQLLSGWTRTTRKSQRTRIVCAGNPPLDDEGQWVTQFWAPWLDATYHKPAAYGELRYFTVLDGKDTEVDGPDPFVHNFKRVTPKSRTFIRGSMDDMIEYLGDDYEATLQAMPEPYRAKLLDGDFSAIGASELFQVIPSAWVVKAQERWRYSVAPEIRMSALGVDPSRGGRDETVLSPRYGAWFAEQFVYPGKTIPDGPECVRHILAHRDEAPVHLDVGGIGSSVYDILVSNEIPVVALNGASASSGTDRSGKILFFNKRAQWHWEMREALDPVTGYNLALPPDPQLRSDLCAARWIPAGRGIKIESKDGIKERLGRSPDRGESLIYALAESAVHGINANLIEVVTLGSNTNRVEMW